MDDTSTLFRWFFVRNIVPRPYLNYVCVVQFLKYTNEVAWVLFDDAGWVFPSERSLNLLLNNTVIFKSVDLGLCSILLLLLFHCMGRELSSFVFIVFELFLSCNEQSLRQTWMSGLDVVAIWVLGPKLNLKWTKKVLSDDVFITYLRENVFFKSRSFFLINHWDNLLNIVKDKSNWLIVLV